MLILANKKIFIVGIHFILLLDVLIRRHEIVSSLNELGKTKPMSSKRVL